MRHKVFTIALAVGLLVGLMGVPAAADISDIGTILGDAQVGKTFWSEDDCGKDGRATVVGEGLYVVGSTLDLQRERQGAWHILTTATAAQRGPLELEACGWLGPHDGTVTEPSQRNSGLGPACGASKGHHGMGEVRNAAGRPILKLMDLGWKDAVGGVLPVTGKYQQYDPDQPPRTKLNKFGTVAAQVVATGGAECLAEPGAQNFLVNGTFQLVNTGDQKLKQPNKEPMFPKECKETDPNTDKVKDTTQKRDCPDRKDQP